MATLDELLNIEGVVAAGEFDADGTLVDYRERMGMSAEMPQMSAQFCATVTMMFNTLAGVFTQLSGMRWVPQQGWAYSGGDWTVAIGGGGYKGVFVKTARADFNRLFKVLVEDEGLPLSTTGSLEATRPTAESGAPPEATTTNVRYARTEVPTGAEPTSPVAPEATPQPEDVQSRPEGGREGARQPEREREDRRLLDRARDAILGEEEEPRRREGADRPEERR